MDIELAQSEKPLPFKGAVYQVAINTYDKFGVKISSRVIWPPCVAKKEPSIDGQNQS